MEEEIKKLKVFYWTENKWTDIKLTPIHHKYIDMEEVIKIIKKYERNT